MSVGNAGSTYKVDLDEKRMGIVVYVGSSGVCVGFLRIPWIFPNYRFLQSGRPRINPVLSDSFITNNKNKGNLFL